MLARVHLVKFVNTTRAAIAEYDPSTDETTLWTTSQNPHLIRLLLAAFVLQIPEHKLRVIAPDVGGPWRVVFDTARETGAVLFGPAALAGGGSLSLPARTVLVLAARTDEAA